MRRCGSGVQVQRFTDERRNDLEVGTINDLIENITKLHTTELGVARIKRNLGLEIDDVVTWCRQKILNPNCSVARKGKNWYATVDGCIITVNAHSYTIITAHKIKN